MQFTFIPSHGLGVPAHAGPFRVERLTHEAAGADRDVSHLIDLTYDYQSARELRWHLADRFGLPVDAVALRLH